MARLLVLLFAVTVLAGCASGGGNKTALSEEQFLELSANNARLIELYKDRLREQESVSTRLKLAKAYLDSGDNESTLFTLSPLITSDSGGSEAFYLQGVAQYNTGLLRQAENSLKIATNKEADSAKAVNMLGVVYAELGNLSGARAQFNQAREMMYDDLVIKNNLALLDMLEGKYQNAAVRLMPIYLKNPDKADAKLKANLAIILSKMGSFETLRRVYGDQYSDAQLFDIFNDLKASMPVSRVYGPQAINPVLQEPVNVSRNSVTSKPSKVTSEPLATKTQETLKETTIKSDAVAVSSYEQVQKVTKQPVKQTAQEKPSFFARIFSSSKEKTVHNFVKLSPYSLAAEDGFSIPIAPLRTIIERNTTTLSKREG